jgi:hypothetical protein
MMNMAEPMATRPFVLSPIVRCCHWRSSPITPAKKIAPNIPNSIQFKVFLLSSTFAHASPERRQE